MLLGALIALMVAAAQPLGAALGDWYNALGASAQQGESITDDATGANGSGPHGHNGSNCSDTGAAASNGKCR